MISVGLITSKGDASDLLRRHTPDPRGTWRGCRFSTWEPEVEYDWVVILHRSLRDRVSVRTDPDHLVYASMEPHEDRSVARGYLDQFSHLILTDPRVRRRGVVRRNVASWWVGHEDGRPLTQRSGPAWFEDLRDAHRPARGSRRISVITSTQDWMPGHRLRNRLLRAVEAHPIGRHLDVFGAGRRPVHDKLAVIAAARYHLVLENALIPGYWSEKLADAFLGFALPLYAGCPDVGRYFPAEALVPVDMTSPRRTIEVLTSVLDEDPYEARMPAILAARDAVLFDHNPLSILASVCDVPARSVAEVTLRAPTHFPLGIARSTVRRWQWRAYRRSRGLRLGRRMLWRLPP